MKNLQEYIVPVVRLSERKGRLYFEQLHGTAFFINSCGAFITAKHVIEQAAGAAEKHGNKIALVMCKPGDDAHRHVGHIQNISFAEAPYDVAVGYVAEPSKSCFAPANTGKVWAWQDVYAAGYAESAVSRDGTSVRPDTRSLKGYVVRKVSPGRFLADVGDHPAAFEVDFAIPHCMSGAPLVLRYGPDETPPPGEPFPLLGVCVASEAITIGKDTEYYGVVHDLWPLRNWKPDCLGGETLFKAIRPDTPH